MNDGSTDSTEQLVLNLIEHDSRIRLVSQDNQGPAGSRDTGLKNATGDYFAWCDSDDWYEPDCLETLYAYLKKYDADIAVCRSQIPGKAIQYDENELQIWNRDEAIDAFLEHKFLNGVLWNKLIKRELFSGISFDKSLWYWEDLQVVWQLIKRANKVVRFNKAKYNFYVHPESMCAKKYSEKRAYASVKVWSEIVDNCSTENMLSHKRNAEKRRYNWLLGDIKAMAVDNYENYEDIKTIQAIIREQGIYGLRYVEGFDRSLALLLLVDYSVFKLTYLNLKKVREKI